jgi:hypothetical protein
MNHKYLLGFLATLTCFVVGQGSASAIEPVDEAAPLYSPYYHNATVYVASHTTSSWSPNSDQQISTDTDNDYITAVCAVGYVKKVRIEFDHAAGDLDMKVYHWVGTYLGVSQGYENWEEFDTSVLPADQRERSLIVMRVYGFDKARNSYKVIINCSGTTTP